MYKPPLHWRLFKLPRKLVPIILTSLFTSPIALADAGTDDFLSKKRVEHHFLTTEARLPELPEISKNPLHLEINVSGRVTDQNGEPLPGVSVLVRGSSIGIATDIEGRYTLSVPEGSVLVFSFIGFQSQVVSVGERSVV